jgi:hypothetical protein
MATTAPWSETRPTALLVLADGTVIEGRGLGATGSAVGEVCFNTALTGYQEILTDPSYAGQIVTFTFPHIGNVGANDEDIEDLTPAARHGAVGGCNHVSYRFDRTRYTKRPGGRWRELPPRCRRGSWKRSGRCRCCSAGSRTRPGLPGC